MSNSKNTLKAEIKVERIFNALENKESFYPKILTRKPFHKDDHPLSKSEINRVLRLIPKKYVFGLKEIELLPRKNSVGQPFAYYSPREKKIVLYSMPKALELKSKELVKSILHYSGTLESKEGILKLYWKDPIYRSIWFCHIVLFHEIGHHYMHQFKTKRKLPKSTLLHEILADLHKNRIIIEEFNRIRSKKKKK